MSSADYGTNNTADEEAPLLHTQVEPQTRWEKIKHTLHLHGHRVLISWIIVLSVTAVLTLSFHFALKHDSSHPDDDDNLLLGECVSDRSWLVSTLLSIFLGCLGIDRLYLGYLFWGILKLLTGGLGGILWVVDIILITLNVLPDHNGCVLH
ncbi:unnamed protein product [Absidia cylindrospora]